jgi:hypothetical protein
MSQGNTQKVVLVGEGETAEIIFTYFPINSNHEQIALSEEKDGIQKTLSDYPWFVSKRLENLYDPKKCKAFFAVSFTELNRIRTWFYRKATKGFSLFSYTSEAFLWRDV